MNRRIAIIIDDIQQAKRQGVWSQFKNLLKKKCTKKQNRPIITIENGDALLVEIDDQQSSYSVEKQFIELLTNGYRRSPLSTLVPEENTFFFMKNYKQIYKLLQDLLDLEDDERGTIRLVVQEPVRPVIHFKTQIKEKVIIFERFVKIGWNTYKRRFDFITGLDFINVDGTIFYVKLDRYGREYLDV